METVQKEQEEFLGILLLVSNELLVELTDQVLEASRRNGFVVSTPYRLDNDGEFVSYFSSEAELVGPVQVLGIGAREEIVEQKTRVTQALNDRVHEARVSQIPESRETGPDVV